MKTCNTYQTRPLNYLARAALASGMTTAVLTVGLGTAHADGQTLTCPLAVPPGGTGTVFVGGFTPDLQDAPVWVNEDQNKVGPGVAGGVRYGNGPLTVSWPTPLGQHTFYAIVINNFESASCTFNVALPAPSSGAALSGGDRVGLPPNLNTKTNGHVVMHDEAPEGGAS